MIKLERKHVWIGLFVGMPAFAAALWFLVDPVISLVAMTIVTIAGWGMILSRALSNSFERGEDSTGTKKPKKTEAESARMLEAFIRQKRALGAILFDRQIPQDELSSVLERLCRLTLDLLSLRGVEITLFDAMAQSLYGGVLVGKVTKLDSEHVRTQCTVKEIRFAGEQIGTLSVWGTGDLSEEEEEILHLLTLQVGVAVVNAKYSEALLRMKGESEASVKAKTGFLANLSHELRGPLGIILNATEIVLDGLCGEVTKDQRDTLGMVKVNSAHLLDLINDVLDYAKAEAGKVTPKPEPLDVSELLRQTVGMIRAQADQKRHKVEVVPPPPGLYIFSDKRHARQILINLLTNAVKYTLDGGRIRVGASRAPGGRIGLWVEDSGVGIADEQRPKVFSAFERIESGYAGRQNGTGLGLSLTRKLVELNGGVIDFKSKVDEGTTFEVVLPAAEAPDVNAGLAGAQAVETHALGNGETVLLVTRNEDEAALVHRYLQSNGFRVIELTGEDLSSNMSTNDGRVLIVGEDTQSDHEALRKMVESAQGIPTVILTNNAFTADTEDYMRLGFARCVARPVQLGELARACVDLIRHG